MSLDIKLDELNKTMLNEYCDGKQRIIQQIKIAVRIWYNHWIWSSEYGVNYAENLNNTILLGQQIQEMVEQVDGVQRVVYLVANSNFDTHGKGQIYVNAIIQLDGTTIRLENELVANIR